MDTAFTDAQMKLWQQVVSYVWTRWVLPVAILAFAAGIVVGLCLKTLLPDA